MSVAWETSKQNRSRSAATVVVPGAENDAELRSRLYRVLNSVQFARSERLCSLLLFLVKSAEDPSAVPLDERMIGISVFSKDTDWDPGSDPSVRVAVSRLRSRLEDYFSNAGSEDELRIELNKGSYVPQIITQRRAAPDEATSSKPAAVRRGRFPRSLGLVALGILALLSVSLLILQHVSSLWSLTHYSIHPLSLDAGVQFSPAFSRDGKTIAYVWDEGDRNYHVYLRPASGGPAQRLSADPHPQFYPAWSPGGESIAYLRNDDGQGRLVIHSMKDDKETTVATIAIAPGRWAEDSGPLLGNPGPAWSADGHELIAFDQAHFGIYAIDIATGYRRQVATDDETSRDFYPRVSRDGSHLAFVHYVSHGVGELEVVRMYGGGRPVQLTHDKRTIRGLDWAPDGRSLIVASNRTGPFELWRMDATTGAATLLPADTAHAANPAYSADGKSIVFDNAEETIAIQQAVVPKGDRPLELHTIVSSIGQNRSASVSPDGKRLIFVSDRSGSRQIWSSAPDGSSLRQLTNSKDSYAGSISWFPDSKHVAYDARPGGHSSIYTLDVDTGQSQLFSRSPAEERTPSVSPDGTAIFHNSNRTGAVSLYRTDIASGRSVLVAADGFRAIETADQRWVYYATQFGVLWRTPASGGEAIKLPPSIQPYSITTWTVAGNALLVVTKSSRPNTFDIWAADEALQIKHLAELLADDELDVLNLNATSDGTKLLFDTRKNMISEIMVRKSN